MTARILRSTWAIPIALGLLTIVGLVVALTGDGWRDMVAWIALGAPVLATATAIARRR